jgi:muconate cycloisomerase
MRIVRSSLGDSCELRIDVNGAWDRDLAFKHLTLLSEHRVKVVEQPLMHGNKDLGGLAEELRDRGIDLMADESACTLRDVEEIIDQGFFNMVNVRLSKCGGFNQSLKIIDLLRKSNLSFQIGCQLGESGVLSAAGRALCLVSSDAAYFDGSYDSFLLKENITAEDVTFGPGGAAGPLGGYGLGVEVDLRKLERLSRESGRIIIKRP